MMVQTTTTGFKGMSSLSTDIEGAIAEAEKIAAAPRRTAATQEATSLATPAVTVYQDEEGVSAAFNKVGGWIMAIGMVFAVRACLGSGVCFIHSDKKFTFKIAASNTIEEIVLVAQKSRIDYVQSYLFGEDHRNADLFTASVNDLGNRGFHRLISPKDRLVATSRVTQRSGQLETDRFYRVY
jgi:hypothetical protein